MENTLQWNCLKLGHIYTDSDGNHKLGKHEINNAITLCNKLGTVTQLPVVKAVGHCSGDPTSKRTKQAHYNSVKVISNTVCDPASVYPWETQEKEI